MCLGTKNDFYFQGELTNCLKIQKTTYGQIERQVYCFLLKVDIEANSFKMKLETVLILRLVKLGHQMMMFVIILALLQLSYF